MASIAFGTFLAPRRDTASVQKFILCETTRDNRGTMSQAKDCAEAGAKTESYRGQPALWKASVETSRCIGGMTRHSEG